MGANQEMNYRDLIKKANDMHRQTQLQAIEQLVDPVRFEADFAREFGIGDEQPIKPTCINREMHDAGHDYKDF